MQELVVNIARGIITMYVENVSILILGAWTIGHLTYSAITNIIVALNTHQFITVLLSIGRLTTRRGHCNENDEFYAHFHFYKRAVWL
ncbi:MAG: hypothetical protein WCR96_05110 [Candidatus Methanomethylophilaceae archaeon]